MADLITTEAIEKLAAEIGETIYMDIAKWHLFLSNAHLHTVLAEKFYPMLIDNRLEEDKVVAILKDIPVKIGGGRREIPLVDLLPMKCQMDLMDLLEDYQQTL